ncbi:hypothetical protein CRG98_008240 [Punica granatum]|uniref:Uncharacterized protein n=1 Tax=Punica granatum TaxID=22663 RepID=A0A2I0KSE3_PUNGR|nr:hypothetical protein CRG98_008240 [Punica granatum]
MASKIQGTNANSVLVRAEPVGVAVCGGLAVEIRSDRRRGTEGWRPPISHGPAGWADFLDLVNVFRASPYQLSSSFERDY